MAGHTYGISFFSSLLTSSISFPYHSLICDNLFNSLLQVLLLNSNEEFSLFSVTIQKKIGYVGR